MEGVFDKIDKLEVTLISICVWHVQYLFCYHTY